jgi:hypothetical protein
MAFLIEQLIGNPVERADKKRISVIRRPMPVRPRELFELFAAMGRTSSFEGLRRSIEINNAEPRTLTQVVLNRWPTNEELAEHVLEYNGWRHLSRMLLSEEFRANLIWRILDAYPEKRRMLLVRIPRCAGKHAMACLESFCPLLPTDIGTKRYASADSLSTFLGVQLMRFNVSRSVSIAHENIHAFIDAPKVTPESTDPLNLSHVGVPFRAADTLFAILRPPMSLAVSVANGLITRLRRPSAEDDRTTTEWRVVLSPLPKPDDLAAWRKIALEALPTLLPTNPICHALGDGTAAGALAACARAPITLIDISGYHLWARSAYEATPLTRINVSEPILREEDLGADEHALIAARLDQDLSFYARFSEKYRAKGLPSITGPDLMETPPPKT